MSNETASFNLIDEPWIRVRMLSGKEAELSLLEVFRQALAIDRLTNDLPTQDFAILRVLLAVLQRSVIGRLDEYDSVSDAWGGLWGVGGLPIEDIESYLENWHHRFNLFDSRQPFMQVEGLRATNGSLTEPKKIIADVPDGNALFSIKALSGLESLEFGEAARWLVHVHAFDTSGIKTGVVGDDAVDSGKSYPIGTGWSGNLGGIYLEGRNLAETLLLNLVLCDDCQNMDDDCSASVDDLPAWEQPQKTPGDDARVPRGYADIYTWQSRRVWFASNGDRVTAILLTNGDRLDAYNMSSVEPMTAWSRSQYREKKLGITPVYLPSTHSAGRAIWRGLTALLPQIMDEDSQDAMSPGVLKWAGYLSSMNGGSHLPRDYSLKVHAVGLVYRNKNSAITELIDDEMIVHAFLISKEGELAASTAKRCMKNTEEAVERVLGLFVKRLRLAAGDDSGRADGVRDSVKAKAYFELDAPYREWVLTLDASTDLAQAEDCWNHRASSIVRAIARQLVEEAGVDAVVGRKVKSSGAEGWLSAGKAESQFNYWLGKVLPYGVTSTQ